MAQEERRVAEYFVVAGLPEKRVVLEDFSEESVIKPAHKQDPIVDICVINRTLGEAPPDKYTCIETTPSGYPADLNHGSIRAHSMFICYRRGRDKPPLTEIGVVYEDKERPKKGCEVISFTPGGRSANVNNTSSSRTYITYQRADDRAPSDTLAVMDICIILQNKGESPPHCFWKINRCLNMGMVCSDVYLCYKKSMAKSNYISYKPAILNRFPPDNWSFILPPEIPMFCLPLGATIEAWPEKAHHPIPVFSTFVLTGATSEKIYGAAVLFYEEFDQEKLNTAEKRQLGLIGYEDEGYHDTKGGDEKEKEREKKSVHQNKCICILSSYPFYETFRKFLFYLYKLSISGPHIVPLERHISHFMNEVPFPSLKRPRILIQLNEGGTISLVQPEENPLPHNGSSFIALLQNLGADNCMNLMLFIMLEHKILLHSLRYAVLTSVAEACASMVFPFQWQCPFIPLCPLGLSDVLSAPTPYIVGIDSRYFDLYDPPSDVTCVNLDTQMIHFADDKKGINYKMLPKKPLKVLKATLERLFIETYQQDFSQVDTGMEEYGMDLDFTRRRKEVALENAIKEAFLRFMACVLRGYDKYLLPITKRPTSMATDLSSLYDMQGFQKSRDKANHKFYHIMVRTQLFARFIEERSFVSDKDDSLAFFDECMEKVDDTKDEPRLIENDDIEKSDRTVFVMPPEPVGLPQDVKYTYTSFPTLDSKLYLVTEKPKLAPNIRNAQPCPNSPMTRRTKLEIKSAQKIAKAQKRADRPDLWAKCLMSHCYSLWFIHLPAYLKDVRSPNRALRTAYDILANMNTTKSVQATDEVCYRVLLQLCGIHHQPLLAIDVLYEMKKNGVQPNAITYGFYNRAVLESKWQEESKHHRLSTYSNADTDCSIDARRSSTDSFLDGIVPLGGKDSAKVGSNVDLVESPNNEEKNSTGGMSDRGYSSMTTEDGKRTSMVIGSEESIDSLGGSGSSGRASGVVKSLFGKLDFKGKKQMTVPEASAHVSELNLHGTESSSTLPASQGDSDSLDVDIPAPTDTGSAIVDMETKDQNEAAKTDTEVLQSGSLLTDTSSNTTESVNIETVTMDTTDCATDTTCATDNTTTTPVCSPNKTISNDAVQDTSNESNLSNSVFSDSPTPTKESEQLKDADSISTGSSQSNRSFTSPVRSIPTPVVENDPLGLFMSQQESDVKTDVVTSESSDTDASKSKMVIDLGEPFSGTSTPVKRNPSTLTNDSGVSDLKDSTARSKKDSFSSSEASSPGSPAKRPLSQSISEHQIGHEVKPETKAKSATLPAQSQASKLMPPPDITPKKRNNQVSRTQSFTKAFGSVKSAATGWFSKFNQFKESMGATPKSGAGDTSSTGSASSLARSHEVDPSLYEEDENRENLRQKSGSLDELQTPGETQSRKTRLMQLQGYYSASGASEWLGGLMQSPYMKGMKSGWDQMKGSFWDSLYQNLGMIDHNGHYTFDVSSPTGPPGTFDENFWTKAVKLREEQRNLNPREFYQQGNSIGAASIHDHYGVDDLEGPRCNGSIQSIPQGAYNVAVEVEICSLSRCGSCEALLYDEEIMAGWSPDDSDLNTRCEFCQSTLVPLLQIYIKDFRQSNKPVMMTPSQSCESMQSIQSMPNVPLHKQRLADPLLTANARIDAKSLDGLLIDDKETRSHHDVTTQNNVVTKSVVSPKDCVTKIVVTSNDDVIRESTKKTVDAHNGEQSSDNVETIDPVSDDKCSDTVTSSVAADKSQSSNVSPKMGALLETNLDDECSVYHNPLHGVVNNHKVVAESESDTKCDNKESSETLVDENKSAGNESETCTNVENGNTPEQINSGSVDVVDGSAPDCIPIANTDGTEKTNPESTGNQIENVTTVPESTLLDAVARPRSVSDPDNLTDPANMEDDSQNDDVPRPRSVSECLNNLDEPEGGAISIDAEAVSFKIDSVSEQDIIDDTTSINSAMDDLKADQRSKYLTLEPVTVNYLSPLVLRKELENVLEQDGDQCLTKEEFVDEHPIIYWNLVWYFKRIDAPSHLPGFILRAKSTNQGDPPKAWIKADSRHVQIKAKWDNHKMHKEVGHPMYILWQNMPSDWNGYFDKRIMQHIISDIKENDLLSPIRAVIDTRRNMVNTSSPGGRERRRSKGDGAVDKKGRYRSIYRDVLFLLLKCYQKHSSQRVRLDTFDRHFKEAFDKLNRKELSHTVRFDSSPTPVVQACRKLFGGLDL